MGLVDEIEQSREFLHGKTGPECVFSTFLKLLDNQDREALQKLLDDPMVYGTRIAKIVSTWGNKLYGESKLAKGDEVKRLDQLAKICADIKETTVQRHRRGACSCRGNA